MAAGAGKVKRGPRRDDNELEVFEGPSINTNCARRVSTSKMSLEDETEWIIRN